jgi:hypothetical protein
MAVFPGYVARGQRREDGDLSNTCGGHWDFWVLNGCSSTCWEQTLAHLVEALRYKPEVRRFDSQ